MRWGAPVLTIVLIFALVLVSGCANVSFGSQKIGDFGNTKDEQKVVEFFKATHGDPLTNSGPPRLLEPMVTTGLVNNTPVNKVTKFSKDTGSIFFWVFYDNFKKGDPLTLTWTFNSKTVISLQRESGGDFGRAFGEFLKPDKGWATGTHTITISGGGTSATATFEIIDGQTQTVPLPYEQESTLVKAQYGQSQIVPVQNEGGVVPPQPVVPAQTIPNCTGYYIGSAPVSSSSGSRTNCTLTVNSDDHVASLTLTEGTIAKGAGNDPLTAISITVANPAETRIPPVQKNGIFTGNMYRCLPDHASFDPPALVRFTLSQEEWDTLDLGNLIIGEISSGNDQWEMLPTVIDPVGRTASAPVSHFSTIGLISQIPVVQGPATTPSVNDLMRQAVGSGTKRSLPLSVIIPDQIAPVIAVAVGIGVALIGTTMAAQMVVSRLLEKILGFFKNYIGVSLVDLTSDKEIERLGIQPSDKSLTVFAGLSRRELRVISASAILFAFAFLLRDRLELNIITILVYVSVAGITVILHDLAHKVSARRCGCLSEYQFWLLGTVTMLLTAGLLGNVFARPARTIIESDKIPTAEERAKIKIAGPLVSMCVAILSLFLIPLGGIFAIAGSAGFTINLLDCIYALLPVTPMDGKDVYTWNRWVWAVVYIPLIIFYLYIYLQT